MRASTFRTFALLLFRIDFVWGLIYNVTYDITNSTVVPDFPITWFPQDAWGADNNGLNSGGGGRVTETQGATMNFTFAGVGFYVTGVKAPTSGIVSFIVDGGPVQTQNISSGNATIFWFRQMLLWQDNLTPATHTVLVNQSSPTGAGHLSLDTIIITRDSDLTGPSSSVPAPAGGTKTPSPNQPTVSTAPGSETGGSQVKGSGTNTGAIVGGVVAGVVALAAIGAAIFFWLRLRKVQSGAGAGERERPASEVRLAAYAPGPTGSTGSYAHSIGAASYGGYGAGSSTIGTAAAATSTAATPAWTTPNAPFVEKPTFGPPPYAHS